MFQAILIIAVIIGTSSCVNNNTDGTDNTVFDETIKKIQTDRPAFLVEFAKKFYRVDATIPGANKSILEWNQILFLMSSAKATTDCMSSFSETDIGNDLLIIKVPVLMIHGVADKPVPNKVSGDKTPELIPHAKYIVQ